MSEIKEPVEYIGVGSEKENPEKGIALCLSGGGYRAMPFHAGVLWRLYETGYLHRLDRISSVSGGSITAGVLGLAWKYLSQGSPADNKLYIQHVIEPISHMASKTIDAFKNKIRKGTYWGIWTDIANYQLPDPLPSPYQRTLELANTPTRLKSIPSDLQQRLINWGYAVCDAAIRKHLDPTILKPIDFPYPSVGV